MSIAVANIMKSYTYKGAVIRVGCNAVENWKMLSTNRKYTWVHLADIPSAHAIIEIEDEPSEDDLEFVRECILEQTKKALGSGRIITAKIGNIRRGASVGQVIIRR